MPLPIRRIAVNTGGGDAPGLNAVIRAVVLSGLCRGWEVYGIRKGYDGLLDGQGVELLSRQSVRGITHVGGTILGTTNRGNPFHRPVERSDGTVETVDLSAQVIANFAEARLDALVAIGGDGSLRIAENLFRLHKLPVVGVPKTIDNDLAETDVTFGFDTAVSIATEALDRLHSTAEAHDRVMVVELMGRDTGWIALYAGVAATCDVVLLPEVPIQIEAVCRKIRQREAADRHFSMVVVAEGAKFAGEEQIAQAPKEIGREVRLGGIGEEVARRIQQQTGKETRVMVLGHLQRGGCPSPTDRVLALRFGAAAVRAVADGKFGQMVALKANQVTTVSLADATAERKRVPLDCDLIQTARQLGICLGDDNF